jgi:hypothetical protein
VPGRDPEFWENCEGDDRQFFFCPQTVKLCCVGFENVLSCSILEFFGSFDWLCLTDVINCIPICLRLYK